MSTKDQQEFIRWYNENKDKVFNFKKEIEEYCLSDVNILKLGCLSFRENYMQLIQNKADIDPFRDCCTLASLCQRTYRTLYMQSQSMALINENGFNPTNQYSKKQIDWLQFIAQRDNIQIQHCLNGKEYQIGNYKVDGYCYETNTDYEFQGCWFHGCTKCFNPSTINPLKKQKMLQLNLKTKQKIKDIIKENYNVVEIWEHDWDIMIKTEELQEFLSKNSISIHLKPREALFGGRTNAVKLHYKCKEGEKIHYYDFTSLYPFVQKTCKYPFGLPEVVTHNFSSINNYFGLIKCTILPPCNLLFPVLPAKINGKLIFTLCFTCAHERNNKCNHQIEERMITGTWVTEEVKLAVTEGYTILKFHSVWHWNEKDTDKGLFSDYVNVFLKAKQENSGYPSWCVNDELKQNYITDYKKNENIDLDIDSIEYNEGKRTISKLMLNSLWGRYCMQTNKPKTAIVKNKANLINFLINDLYEVKDVVIYKEVCHVSYKDKDFLHQGNKDANIVLGCFVTAYGRLKLYSEMKKIGNNLLYFDTDSLIFIEKDGSYVPELGDYLGDFTSELNKDEYIEEFVSGGPKNYAYRTNKDKECIKVKGFSLNVSVQEKLNFTTINELVQNNNNTKIPVNQTKFKRHKVDWSMTTEEQIKTYKKVYDKRILLEDLSSLPYGFCY